MRPFPIPVTMIGPGSQSEDEQLDYLPMPQGMETFRPPRLPEPEALAGHDRPCAVLQQTLAALEEVRRAGGHRRVDLAGLAPEELALVNQVLGEGEVSARVQARPGRPAGLQGGTGLEYRVQESVFAGVWRVIHSRGGRVLADHIEVGALPPVLLEAAAEDVLAAPLRWQGPLPAEVQNAPLLLAEIEDQWRAYRPGQAAHVVNLTLLPMSVQDIAFLDHHLGTGRVTLLSRGYGNCRITNTCMPNCWRVVYYNSQDTVILNTVEVVSVPEVALAAPEDLQDSFERLADVLAWFTGGAGDAR